MSTKKQARAAEKRRHEQLAAKAESRSTARQRRIKVVGVIAAVAIVGSFVGFGAVALFPTDSTTPDDGTDSEGGATDPIPGEAPAPSVAEGREWTAQIDTSQGPLTISLDGSAAPQAVASFVTLAKAGYFDGTTCHRLVTAGIYVLQCGDPTATGTGGPGYNFGPIENAPADDLYRAGTFAMARQGGDGESMGSQFFIVFEDSVIPSDGAGGYTVFGTVTDGIAIVETVAREGTVTGGPDGAPALPVVLNEVSVS